MEVLFFIVCLVLYFLPGIIASCRGHKNVAPIVILNFAFGWTFVGWICVFAWAFSSNIRED